MENLGIDVKLLIAQLVNFVLFLFIFKKFLAKPFMTFLKDEEKKEQEKAKIMQDIQKQQELYESKEKELAKKMKLQTEAAVKQAKDAAQRTKEEMLEEAKKEADSILAKAHKQTEEERKKLEGTMKDTVGKLSIFLLNQSFKDYVDDETRKKITKYILTNVSKAISSHEN